MKKLLTILFLALAIGSTNAQTATNFNCNDCSGVNHDLFSELDSGKVIVMVWVMPCGACAGPATTAFNTVQNFQATHPNKVYLYLVDDYANTSCNSLNTWANGLGITQNAWSLRFSNSAIDMMDYGSTGMPKTVVVGGSSHSVYYNVNNTTNQAALQNAINSALSATGIQEAGEGMSLNVFPNPASENATVRFSLDKSSEINISLYDLQGKLIRDLFSGFRNAGSNEFSFDTSEYPAGNYMLRISDGTTLSVQNLCISSK